MYQHKGRGGQKSSTFAYLDVIHGLTKQTKQCVIWPRESVSDPQDAEARQQGPGQADAGRLCLRETRGLSSGLAAGPPGMGAV